MAILMMSVIITPFTANATRTSIEQVGENITNVTSDGGSTLLMIHIMVSLLISM